MDSKYDCQRNLNDNFEFPGSSEELRSIIANVTWDNPVSEILFMGKYLVFLLENLMPYQEPIEEYFKATFVICGAKRKKLSEKENIEGNISMASPVEQPLLVILEELSHAMMIDQRRSANILQRVYAMYDIYPLPLRPGKKLLFQCSQLENLYNLPYVSICGRKKPANLVFYGAGRKKKDFSLKFLNQGNVSAAKSLPSIEDLKISHMEGLPLSLTSESCIDTYVTALYNFLGSKSTNNLNLLVIDTPLSVKCTWHMPSAMLEPPPAECMCLAEIKTVAGDDKSGAFVKYKEIKLLKALQQSLKTGVMTWISSNSLDMVLGEINELANEERKKNLEYAENYQNQEDFDKLETVIKERLLLSLPEKLWLILKNCSSFEDLIAAIEYTYQVFADLNITSIAVFRDDTSTISRDITSMLAKEFYYKKQERNKKQCAEMLLEIGVEKLRRDYHDYFINHGLVTQDLFNHFTTPALLSSEAVTCLEKLHSALELTLVCIKKLNLPRNILNEFARNALRWSTTVPALDLQHAFKFHIPTVDIRPILNFMKPVVWELSFLSQDQNYMKQSYHRFGTTTTHDHMYAPRNYHPTVMLKGATYVYSTGILIEGNDV